jgi:predicted AAA+ superfamily ATPase
VQAKADDKVAREVGLPVDEDRAEKLALVRRFLSQGAYARMSDEDKLEVANKMLAKYGITTTIEELKQEEATYTKTATNPDTGDRVGWDGKQWVPIQ